MLPETPTNDPTVDDDPEVHDHIETIMASVGSAILEAMQQPGAAQQAVTVKTETGELTIWLRWGEYPKA